MLACAARRAGAGCACVLARALLPGHRGKHRPRPHPLLLAGKWSAAGSLAEAQRPRLYHSIALLLPDCTVLTGGSDVSWDQTAEIFRPPYLSKGPRPVITDVGPTTLKVRGWCAGAALAAWHGGGRQPCILLESLPPLRLLCTARR